VASIPVRVSISTALREMVFLVKWFSVIFAIVELPLVVLLLPDVVVQSDRLIKQSLVAWSISY
jgi:hypothetical protein